MEDKQRICQCLDMQRHKYRELKIISGILMILETIVRSRWLMAVFLSSIFAIIYTVDLNHECKIPIQQMFYSSTCLTLIVSSPKHISISPLHQSNLIHLLCKMKSKVWWPTFNVQWTKWNKLIFVNIRSSSILLASKWRSFVRISFQHHVSIWCSNSYWK